MAVELFSDNSGMSPRISFSHDLCHFDVVPVEQRPLRSKSSGLNSSIDFDFCVRERFDLESSSADELFSDGKILPTEIKKKTAPSKQNDDHSSSPPPPCPRSNSVHEDSNSNANENSKKDSSKENKITRDETGDEVEEKQSSKSFWGFKRSSSLNCGSGYGRSLCPLPLLSRSNSTGSTPNVKQASISKDSHSHKQNSHKHGRTSSSSSSYKSTSSYQKPPLRKSYKHYGNGVQVNPVLNVPSGNLFGLGSIFFNSKDKNHHKK